MTLSRDFISSPSTWLKSSQDSLHGNAWNDDITANELSPVSHSPKCHIARVKKWLTMFATNVLKRVSLPSKTDGFAPFLRYGIQLDRKEAV
jgi:hypothetical protein